jgi:hypothetical protein
MMSATHLLIANLMVAALCGCVFEYAATAMAYGRDRH